MIWEDEQELIEELLYWQKRALQVEKERKYFKQQFLDKQRELEFILGGYRGDREYFSYT